MLMRNTRESALRREEFHRVLQDWLDESFDDCIGEDEGHAGSAWLWVRHGGDHFYLHAGCTRTGVREYMRAVIAGAGEVEWQVRDGTSDVRDRVAIGRAGQHIDGFDFFRHVPRR
jgi:hypothetical protein